MIVWQEARKLKRPPPKGERGNLMARRSGQITARGERRWREPMTGPESWRSSLEAMTTDELDALLTDEERAQWFRAIAGRLPDDQTPVREVLTEEELRELLAGVLAETRASA